MPVDAGSLLHASQGAGGLRLVALPYPSQGAGGLRLVALSYAAGPVTAVVVVIMLSLFIRWAFTPSRPSTGSVPARGLLHPVATTGTRESALALRAVLSDAGIRSTITPRDSSHVDVLVFADDVPRARSLALGFGQINDA